MQEMMKVAIRSRGRPWQNERIIRRGRDQERVEQQRIKYASVLERRSTTSGGVRNKPLTCLDHGFNSRCKQTPAAQQLSLASSVVRLRQHGFPVLFLTP